MRFERILLILSVFLIIGFYSEKLASVAASATDCDEDGILDSEDTDIDGDGLLNTEEVDTDGDGVYDPSKGETDPRNCDTDGDGMPDGLDVAYEQITEILIKVGSALGVLMIAIGGVKWIISESPKGRDDARKSIMYVVIGLMLLISADKLVEYLLGSVSGLCICH